VCWCECVQTQSTLYDLVVEMNARQQVLERRTDNIEDGLSRLQVRPPDHTRRLIPMFPADNADCSYIQPTNISLIHWIFLPLSARRDDLAICGSFIHFLFEPAASVALFLTKGIILK